MNHDAWVGELYVELPHAIHGPIQCATTQHHTSHAAALGVFDRNVVHVVLRCWRHRDLPLCRTTTYVMCNIRQLCLRTRHGQAITCDLLIWLFYTRQFLNVVVLTPSILLYQASNHDTKNVPIPRWLVRSVSVALTRDIGQISMALGPKDIGIRGIDPGSLQTTPSLPLMPHHLDRKYPSRVFSRGSEMCFVSRSFR